MKKIFLLFLVLLGFTLSYGQNTNMIRPWVLNSVEISEIFADDTEIRLIYDDVANIFPCIYDKVYLYSEGGCRVECGEEEIDASYTLTRDRLIISCRNEEIPYLYKFDGTLLLQREFAGMDKEGNEIKYRIKMHFDAKP